MMKSINTLKFRVVNMTLKSKSMLPFKQNHMMSNQDNFTTLQKLFCYMAGVKWLKKEKHFPLMF